MDTTVSEADKGAAGRGVDPGKEGDGPGRMSVVAEAVRAGSRQLQVRPVTWTSAW